MAIPTPSKDSSKILRSNSDRPFWNGHGWFKSDVGQARLAAMKHPEDRSYTVVNFMVKGIQSPQAFSAYLFDIMKVSVEGVEYIFNSYGAALHMEFDLDWHAIYGDIDAGSKKTHQPKSGAIQTPVSRENGSARRLDLLP